MNREDNRPSFLKVGTPQCALFCGFLGLVLAVLLLTIGFWRTLMLAVFMLLGAFIGGVKDKRAFVQEKLSALVPSGEKKPYRATVYPAGMTPDRKTAPAAEPAEEEEEEEEEAVEEAEDAQTPAEDEDVSDPVEETEAEEASDSEEDDGEEEKTSWSAGPETRDGRFERAAK